MRMYRSLNNKIAVFWAVGQKKISTRSRYCPVVKCLLRVCVILCFDWASMFNGLIDFNGHGVIRFVFMIEVSLAMLKYFCYIHALHVFGDSQGVYFVII